MGNYQVSEGLCSLRNSLCHDPKVAHFSSNLSLFKRVTHSQKLASLGRQRLDFKAQWQEQVGMTVLLRYWIDFGALNQIRSMSQTNHQLSHYHRKNQSSFVRQTDPVSQLP